MSTIRSTLRPAGVAVRALLLATVMLGVGYTAVVTAGAQLLMPGAANGSLVVDDRGAVVGSALIGQSFTDADGEPLPEYFQSRPSATDYDGGASSGSNLGPENADLITAIEERRAAVAAFESVPPEAVPVDALTASASGLDPHISVAYAALQVPRIADERSLDAADVQALVDANTAAPDLGMLGEARIDVLELNLALDALG